MPRGLCYDALRTTLVAKCAATREEKEGIMAEECSHECSSCGVSGCGDRTAEAGPSTLAPNKRTNVKHVIGVVSGKGGVGKSLVTSLLASEMNKRGHKVAILDADITGPSIPKSFGVDSRLTADADGINPAKSASGIEVMSVNLMLPEGDMPVAWRGPVVTGAIKQFWQEVNWGDVDYMFVDMPPGTSDVFLTVFQSLPVDGIVTVSAPQELVAMIVGKAVNLAKSLEVPVVVVALPLVPNFMISQDSPVQAARHLAVSILKTCLVLHLVVVAAVAVAQAGRHLCSDNIGATQSRLSIKCLSRTQCLGPRTFS